MSSAVFSLRSYSATSSLPKIDINEAVKQWPHTQDCLVVQPSSNKSIEISACPSYTASELDAFGVPLRFRYEEPFIASDPNYCYIVTNNATIVGDTAVIVNGEGSLLLESLFPHDRLQPFERLQLLSGFTSCEEEAFYDEDVFLLYGGGGFKNFWHFHVDMLPVITFLRDKGLFQKIKIAVPARSAWHKDALRRMDVNDNSIIELGNKYNKFRRCHLFSTIYEPTLTVPNEYARKTFAHLRLRAVEKTSKSLVIGGDHKLVYVARTDSTSRMMVNEDALIDGLRRLGFEIAVLSEIGYEAQVELFASSSVVVGAHGAGLTNILVADRSALLVEILPFGILRAPHYHFLAKSLGIKYEIFTSKIKPSVSPHEYWTLEVEDFLFRLVCILGAYGFADRDRLINLIGYNLPAVGFSGSVDLMFSSNDASECLTRFGFSGLEHWGCWVTEKKAAIRFRFPLPVQFRLQLMLECFSPALSQPIVFSCGISSHNISKKVETLDAVFHNPQRSQTIWIDAPGAMSQVAAEGLPSGDGRSLSVAIKQISIIELR